MENLVYKFLLGPLRSLRNDFDKVNWVCGSNPLNTYLCEVLEYSLKNDNALSNFIPLIAIFTTIVNHFPYSF